MSVQKIIHNPLIIAMDRATELLRLKLEMTYHDFDMTEAGKKYEEITKPSENEPTDLLKIFTETQGTLRDKCSAIGIHTKSQYDIALNRWKEHNEPLAKALEECKSLFEMRGGERKVVKPLLPKYRL